VHFAPGVHGTASATTWCRHLANSTKQHRFFILPQWPHYMKTWHHPQNRKCITCIVVRRAMATSNVSTYQCHCIAAEISSKCNVYVHMLIASCIVQHFHLLSQDLLRLRAFQLYWSHCRMNGYWLYIFFNFVILNLSCFTVISHHLPYCLCLKWCNYKLHCLLDFVHWLACKCGCSLCSSCRLLELK